MSDAPFSIREGSSLHYSLLWTTESARQRFIQRLHLVRTLATTLDDVQEPQVAQKKIHWWHEELQRLHSGEARHPVTQASQDSLQSLDSAMSTCLEIVSVASTQRFTPAATTHAGNTELARSYRARMSLLAHALSDNTDDLEPESHPEIAALALAHHEQLIRLPYLLHRGLSVFSDELYQQFSIRPHDLAEQILIAPPEAPEDPDRSSATRSTALDAISVVADKPGRQALLANAIEQARTALHEATADQHVMERYRCEPLLPLWRLLVLRKHQLDLWHKRQPNLLRERTTLTPVMKFFRAWQNRR